MRVYMDLNTNEIVTEDVARARYNNDIEGYEMMNFVSDLSWDELVRHLDPDFVNELYDKYCDENFASRFDEYDLIESE